MSHAAMNAARVYEACHKALAARRQANMDVGQHEADYNRLGRVADLAHHVASLDGDEATVFISVDDYAMFNGHWPSPIPHP